MSDSIRNITKVKGIEILTSPGHEYERFRF